MKKSFEQAKRRRDTGVRYKHDLGQHFLYDEGLLGALVAETGVTHDDDVLEIGPGSGMLTKCLLDSAHHVLAVEVDADVLPFLRLKTEGYQNLTIVKGDIRKLNVHELTKPLQKPFYVIANIPYNITTPIFDLLWESGLPIKRICVMVQKEVADKLVAAPSTSAYGLLSVKCQYWGKPSIVQVVPAEAFTPPPNVDSAFVVIERHEELPVQAKDEALFKRMVKAGFLLRRKTLTNALKGVLEPDTLSAAFEKTGISPSVRGEALDAWQWMELANACAGAQQT